MLLRDRTITNNDGSGDMGTFPRLKDRSRSFPRVPFDRHFNSAIALYGPPRPHIWFLKMFV